MKKPLILGEMTLFFCAFFLPGYLAQGSLAAPSVSLTNPLMMQSILAGLPQFLLMAFVVIVPGSTPGSRWGFVPFTVSDALRTGLLVLACFAAITPFVALVLALPGDVAHRLGKGFRWGLAGPQQIPLAFLFGVVAGYREEFFFRAYLLSRFEELGVPAYAAVAGSTLLFCTGHFYEGLLAVGITAALGIILAAAWQRRGSLHVVAIAHGLYNALVLCLGLLLPRALPDPASITIF